jgi:hypothetical protein
MRILLKTVLISLFVSVPHTAFGDTIRVAVIGNSITEWSSYHQKLQSLLGSSYYVRRFSRASVTITRHEEIEGSGDYSIWNGPMLNEAWSFNPHFVTIMLGVNDAKPNRWPSSEEQLKQDYQDLLDSFLVLQSVRRIYVIRPCPIIENEWDISNDTIQFQIWPILDSIATAKQLCKIDAYTPLLGHPEYIAPDGVHLNNPGPGVNEIAKLIHAAIVSDSSCDRISGAGALSHRLLLRGDRRPVARWSLAPFPGSRKANNAHCVVAMFNIRGAVLNNEWQAAPGIPYMVVIRREQSAIVSDR